MKTILKLSVVFILLFCACFTYTPAPKIHVYYDPATSPALLQMVDFIHQDEQDIKFIFWKRFDRYIKNKEKYPNTYFINNWDLFFKKLQEISKANPKSKIILHHNLHHDYFFNHFIDVFPENKILESHAYEDASNYMWWSQRKDYIFFNYPKINHKLHMWGDIKKLCSTKDPHPQCERIKKLDDLIKIIPVDFYALKNNLAPDDLEKVAVLAGVDLKKYQKLLKGKKTGLYLLGFIAGTNLESFQLVALKDLCKAYKDTTWFYKPHPSYIKTPTHKVLNHLCPNIKKLDHQLPFEFLILADLAPQYVAGIGSSTFANLNPENILFYIQRGSTDTYINTLKKAEILPKNGKVITPEQSIKKIMKLNMFFVNTSGWFIKIDNEYCKMMQNECYTIVDDTPTTKTFKNNKNQLVKTKHIESYNWSQFELINE